MEINEILNLPISQEIKEEIIKREINDSNYIPTSRILLIESETISIID